MMLTFDIQVNIPADVLAEPASRAEHDLAVLVAKDTNPYVPASGAPAGLYNRTQVKEGTIIYPGPYARYLYFGKVMVDAQGHGPRRFIGKYGDEVIAFPKGSKLHATDRNLVFRTDHHPMAQDHWFEASKAVNMDKWDRAAGEAMKRELDR